MKVTAKVGEMFFTNEGYKITLIEYNGWYNCTVQFDDGNIVPKLILGNIKEGKVKNPFLRTAFGIGYYGVGKYNGGNNTVKYYTAWKAMFQRCYDSNYHKLQPTYTDCEVDIRWHNFQNFAEWYEENYKEKWDLDKDFLFKGNKIYSPDTCRFLPREINSIISSKGENKEFNLPIGVRLKKNGRYSARVSKHGKRIHLGTYDTSEEAFQAYKEEKEAYIKEVANKWKDEIDSQIYENLMRYEVKITD